MPSEYSPKLRLELIGAGEQAGLWGATTNKNIGQLIEQAIAGVTTIDLSGGGVVTLTALDGTPDQARSAVIKCIGAPAAAVTVVIPTQTKLYVFRNDCGQTITVKTALQVGGVALLNGEATLIFCDGTNAIPGIATAGAGPTTVNNGGTGTNTFAVGGGFIKSPAPGGTTPLTSVAAINIGSGSTDITGILPVGSGGTGASTLTSGRVLLGNGASTPTQLAGGANNDVLTWDSGLNSWKSAAPTGAGVTSITGSNIGVSPSTGPVTITLSGANVTNALGYTPYNSTNPSGYITSSALSGYATLSGSNTWSSANTFSGGLSSRASNPNANWGSFFQSPAGNPAIAFSSQGAGSAGIAGVIDGSGSINWALWYTGNPFSYTPRGGVEWNGSVIVYSGQSDYRLKENVVPLNNAITKLKALKPVQFTWKEFPATGNHDGFIAHEFQEVIPDGVTGKKDDVDKDGKIKPQGLDASFAIPLLTKALQEAIARIETLEAEVAALKGA